LSTNELQLRLIVCLIVLNLLLIGIDELF